MIKKNLQIVIIPFLLICFGFQNPELSLDKSIPVKASFISTDDLGNVYVVKEDVLEKYDGKGNLLKTYSNKSFGKISSVDVSNLLKVILFYKDFSQVVFLDNTLSLNGEPIRLADIDLELAQLVCSSHDNGLWIYNQQNFELIRLDQNLQKTHQTGNINQLLQTEINPNFLMEYNNKVYLNNPSEGILVFDVYGTYYKTIPIKNLNEFQVHGDNLLYYSGNQLKSFNIKLLDEQMQSLPDSTAISVRLEKDKLFLLKKNSLDIYSVNQK